MSVEVRPMARRGHKRLGDFLLDEGAITKAQLDEALEVQKRTGERLGRILARIGRITEHEGHVSSSGVNWRCGSLRVWCRKSRTTGWFQCPLRCEPIRGAPPPGSHI